MSLPKEAAPCSRTSSPVVFICAVLDATAAAMWLWNSKPSWFWGDSSVGDAGGVFWMDCLRSSQLPGTAAGCVALFGDSGLGHLGGRFGVVGSRGEAVGDSRGLRLPPCLYRA